MVFMDVAPSSNASIRAAEVERKAQSTWRAFVVSFGTVRPAIRDSNRLPYSSCTGNCLTASPRGMRRRNSMALNVHSFRS